MYTRINNKACLLFIIAGFFIIASSYATVVFSSGISAIFQQQQTPDSERQWPVVKNGSRETLGMYGGIYSAYNQAGSLESAILVILQDGYIVPVLDNGDIATFPVVYFTGGDCRGREYYPVSEPLSGSLPVRGIVYHSMVSKNPVYIPRDEESTEILAKSRLFLNPNGITECTRTARRLRVLEAIPNSPEITGVYDDALYHSVYVEAGSFRDKSKSRYTSSRDELPGTHGNEGFPDDADYSQQECSPGCLLNTVGNGSCDTECYVEACSYDQGDCDAIDPARLQQMLSDMCSPGCFSADIGDSFCDSACNTQACQFDNGDCNPQ